MKTMTPEASSAAPQDGVNTSGATDERAVLSPNAISDMREF